MFRFEPDIMERFIAILAVVIAVLVGGVRTVPLPIVPGNCPDLLLQLDGKL